MLVLAAYLHLFFQFQEKLQLISVLGAGLLVGTALAVIIPEGVRALLDVPQASIHGKTLTNFFSSDWPMTFAKN